MERYCTRIGHFISFHDDGSHLLSQLHRRVNMVGDMAGSVWRSELVTRGRGDLSWSVWECLFIRHI